MNIDNYRRILTALKVTIRGNNFILNDTTIPFTNENAIKLFNYLTQFSVTEQDKSLIILYYGLDSVKPMTLGELAEMFNRSDESIRCNIHASMRKIAHRLNKQRSYSRFIQEVNR